MTLSKCKKYIFLCGVLCCAVFLLSCEPGKAGKEGIFAPVDIRYLVENPLEISAVTENHDFGGMTYEGNFFRISGLKDQQVENKINQKLESIYSAYDPREIPREATDTYPELLCVKQVITLLYNGNFNNVLSVRASYCWEYIDENIPLEEQKPPFGPTLYEIAKTYNIDLNTGEEISLKEVFADNVDYAGIIKDSLAERLDAEEIPWGEELLDSCVKQYLAEPDFSLGHASLQLTGIHYPAPYSDFSRSYFDLFLHFDENFAITERFYDPENNIYTGDLAGEKTLLTYVGEEEGWEAYSTEKGVDIRLAGSYQKVFPEEIRQAIRAEGAADSKRLLEMKEILKNQADPEVFATYDKNVTTSRVQDFINVRTYENSLVFSRQTGATYLEGNHQRLKCYRLGSSEPVDIRSIFAEGVDVDALLERLVREKLEGDQQRLEASGYKRTMDVTAQAKGAPDKFLGFCINHESIVAEYQGDPALPSYVMELKYSDIGFRNLNLFD